MSLFGFGKKAGSDSPAVAHKCSRPGTAPRISGVKVLGAGCKSCHKLYENAKEAVKALGLDLEVEYITDMQKIMTYGAISMPVLVVNEKIVSSGRVPSSAAIETLLKKSGN